jgi:hypothetical protein
MRATDFRRGRRLGLDDHLVCWKKPKCPDWMSAEEHEVLPSLLTLREVRVRVKQRGFRTKEVIVVTTLLDPAIYSAEAIAMLYRRRWQAELNLRSLKIVLQMDHLRCKTPHRVRNEFYMHLVAYNLIRKVMAMTAVKAGVEPWTVSFKGTLQTLGQFLPLLHTTPSIEVWCHTLLEAIATHPVGHRPDRFEPRRIKRRPKSHKLLLKPRQEYKRQVA